MLFHKNRIRLGNGVTLGNNVEINTLFVNGVVIGNNFNLGSFSVIRCTVSFKKLGKGVKLVTIVASETIVSLV